MPVDSMATVFTPHSANQSAKAIKSAVQVPKERTCAGRLIGWLASGGGAWTWSPPKTMAHKRWTILISSIVRQR